MRKSTSLHILYSICALCVVNTILSPVVRNTISDRPVFVAQPIADFNPWLDLLSLPGEVPDSEKDDLIDQEDFISLSVSSPAGLRLSEIRSLKIPTQESLLECPVLSKFKPPPKLNA